MSDDETQDDGLHMAMWWFPMAGKWLQLMVLMGIKLYLPKVTI